MKSPPYSTASTDIFPNFDNLLLQSLMNKLQIRPQFPVQAPSFLNQTLEDLLLDTINNLSGNDEDDDDEEDSSYAGGKTQLAKEESKLEKEIIRTILGGKMDTLKPIRVRLLRLEMKLGLVFALFELLIRCRFDPVQMEALTSKFVSHLHQLRMLWMKRKK